jgi:hypothetical protein
MGNGSAKFRLRGGGVREAALLPANAYVTGRAAFPKTGWPVSVGTMFFGKLCGAVVTQITGTEPWYPKCSFPSLGGIQMSTTLWIILIAVVAIAAIAVWALVQKRRTMTLRSRFGPEYEHAIEEYGTRRSAEKALEHRAERTGEYHIRLLSAQEQNRFSEDWRRAQVHFVDDPPLAIREADRLVCEVMRTKGYPMADFERRAEDLSVDHPHVVRNYRTAHEVAITEQAGRATTENLRRAMVHYRELFDELLEMQPAGSERRS